jgi:hypothetical protein
VGGGNITSKASPNWGTYKAQDDASKQRIPDKNESRHYDNSSSRMATSFSHAMTILEPLSFGACCGLGHRITRNIPTLVFAMRRNRHAYACWDDVPWSVLFNDTAHITEGKRQKESHDNGYPGDWAPESAQRLVQSVDSEVWSSYGRDMQLLFHLKEAWEIVTLLRNSLSTRVLHKMSPNRQGYRQTHVCAHFRFGNNETGDWMRKTWRHISSPNQVMNATLQAMVDFVNKRSWDPNDRNGVSVFIASDTPNIGWWFKENAPSNWHILSPENVAMDLPTNGVWFGEHGSQTGANLTQESKNDKMAAAAADMFLLGECSALFIPTYSSFTALPIILSNTRNATVMYRKGVDYVKGSSI